MTTPIEKVLNRDLSRVSAKELIDRICPMLDEVINYGTNLYMRHAHSLTEMLSEEGVPLLIYLQILEMTDGAAELLRESCVIASVPVVRAAFESVLALEYIQQADSTDRAFAWIVGYVTEQLDACNKVLGEGKAGQKLQAALASDTLAGDIDLSKIQPVAAKQKTKWEKELTRPELAVAVAQHAASKNPYPAWYSLFGGPTNLRELAARVNREAQYNVLYGHFSSIAHGQNLHRFISASTSKNPLVRILREASAFDHMGILAAGFALRATYILSTKYSETEQYQKWYTSEIRQRFLPQGGA